MSLEIQCRHKNCDLHGICEDCGAKARIFIEGVPANQRSVVDMRPVSGETPPQEKIISLEVEIRRLRSGIVAIGSIMLEGRDIHEMYYYKKLESLLNPPTGCPVPGCTRTDTHIHDSIGEAV